MHHVVIASFGAANVFVFDLQRREITAKISEAVAEDGMFWRRTLLPIAIGVLGASIGVLPVHSACLSRAGHGMMIAGESGAGKSTLAVALAQRGFDYISDDWTFCTASSCVVRAHGTQARIKLLPDAVRHFTALRDFQAGVSMNGEPAYEVAAEELGIAAVAMCTPRLLLFLTRTECGPCHFSRLDHRETATYLRGNVERLPKQLALIQTARGRLMDSVGMLPAWQLNCSGPPDLIAAEVEAFFDTYSKKWAA